MFGDVGQARTNAAMLLLIIATTSSRTCTKLIVVCSFSSHLQEYPLLSRVENNIKDVRISTLQKIVELGFGGQLQLSIKL